MLKDLKVNCENGYIRVEWRWNTSDVDYARIYYRKKGVEQEGFGAIFQGNVVRGSGQAIGCAEKKMTAEDGIFIFTAVPVYKNKELEDKAVCREAVLGMKEAVSWRLARRGDEAVISFALKDKVGSKFTIPSGAVIVECNGYRQELAFEINEKCKLAFPQGVADVKIYAKELYEQRYIFIQDFSGR